MLANPSAPAWSSRQHGPLLTAEGQRRPGAKRAEDLVLGTALLVLPLMVAIAVAIRIDTPGPALFRQTRWGLNVGQVKVDAALHLRQRVGFAAKAIDLRPTGDARRHTMAIRIAGNQRPKAHVMRQGVRTVAERLVRRRTRPTRVTRGLRRRACGTASSAPITNQSLRLDLRILVRTVRTVCRDRNA